MKINLSSLRGLIREELTAGTRISPGGYIAI